MSIKITTEVEIARCYDHPDGYAKRAPYKGVAVIEYAHPLCTVTGMHGDFSRADLLDILHHARDRGADTMIIERAGDRGMPWATRITDGVLQGWWQIDLHTIPEQPNA